MFSSCFLWGKPTGRVPPPARLRHHQPGQPHQAPAPPLTKHRTQPQGHPPVPRHPWGHRGSIATQGVHTTSPVTSPAPITTAQAWFICEFCTGNCPDSAN